MKVKELMEINLVTRIASQRVKTYSTLVRELIFWSI